MLLKFYLLLSSLLFKNLLLFFTFILSTLFSVFLALYSLWLLWLRYFNCLLVLYSLSLFFLCFLLFVMLFYSCSSWIFEHLLLHYGDQIPLKCTGLSGFDLCDLSKRVTYNGRELFLRVSCFNNDVKLMICILILFLLNFESFFFFGMLILELLIIH